MTDTTERHFLLEARQILDAKDGEARYKLERGHLEALEEQYQVELIRFANALEKLKQEVLNT